jgi:hypothetical protein
MFGTQVICYGDWWPPTLEIGSQFGVNPKHASKFPSESSEEGRGR